MDSFTEDTRKPGSSSTLHSTQTASESVEERKRRSYKACLHCRSRKARCDLGSIDAPSSPPCTRCRRESRECVFAPSRRGGNVLAKRKRQRDGSSREESDHGSEDGLITVKVDEDEIAGQMGSMLPPRSQQPPSYRQGMGMGTAGPTVSGSYQNTNVQSMGPLYDGSFGTTNGVTAQHVSMRPPPPRPPGPTPLQPQVPAPAISNQRLMHSSYQNYPNPSPAQPHPTQPLIGATSPLRYSSLQNLLLPSPGGTTYSQSSYSMSGESPMGLPSDSAGSQSGAPHERTLLQSATTHENTSPNAKRQRLSDRSTMKLRDGSRSTPQSIVKADMHNESDALAILAFASREVEQDGERERVRVIHQEEGGGTRGSSDNVGTSGGTSGTSRSVRLPSSPSMRNGTSNNRPPPLEEPFIHGNEAGMNGKGSEYDAHSEGVSMLGRFDLVKRGVMLPVDVVKLCEMFFRRHHHIFPMVAASVIPRNPDQIARFAISERYLVTSMIIIASRHDQSPRMREIHDRSWAVMREYMNDVFYLGLQPTVGLVEGLLLLAENLPRNPDLVSKLERAAGETKEGVHGAENRQAWMLTGMAIRTAYGLGIDQISTTVRSEDEGGKGSPELERARLAWTYCFLFDRHISLRLGKAFWSRGPNLCFRGYSHLNQTGPVAARVNFPTLIAGPQRRLSSTDALERLDEGADELGCLVQAYVELTQLMSNAHDVLYPSQMRTHSLVKYGEYFKYMDDFNLSLETFQTVWKNKRWHTFPLTDIVWCMFHYVRLYISAFSFQAHVERASERAEQEAASRRQHEETDPDQAWRPPESLFPRGGAASPDARYIYESIRAATEILIICVQSLHPGGALPYLPSRFTLLFQYGAVFLLKAVYSGAMVRSDTVKTLQLIDRLCFCLASSSQDKEHPAVRYAAMLRLLSKKLAEASTSGMVRIRDRGMFLTMNGEERK